MFLIKILQQTKTSPPEPQGASGSAPAGPHLSPKALIDAQRLRAEAVPDLQVVHEVGQVDGPHTLGQLQLPARLLKVVLTDWVQIPETPNTEG